LIDEAYYEFCDVTVAPLLHENKNLMVARSFSKAFGLAGLRLGYLMSHPDNLDWIDRIRVGKNTSALAQIAALAALGDLAHLRRVIEETRSTMAALAGRLAGMGLDVRTTPANFLLVRVHDPDTVARYLANNLIFVRNRNHEPGLEGWLRITIGTPALIERIATAFTALPPALLYGREEPLRALHIERPPEEPAHVDLRAGADRGGRLVAAVATRSEGEVS
jgi:histidinol-phosphate aminotransferase